MSNQYAVVWEQEMLTGLSAGRKTVKWVILSSRTAAMREAKDMREAKVMETELTNEMYRVRKVKVVGIKRAYPADYLRNVYAKTLAAA